MLLLHQTVPQYTFLSPCLSSSYGAAGKIKAASERASLAAVIASLAEAPGRGPSVARVAAQAVEFICG